MKLETIKEKAQSNELNDFLNYLKDNLSYEENTLIAYGEDVSQFLSYLIDNKIELDMVNRSDLRLYVASMKSKNYENSTLLRKIASLRHFYNYLVLYKDYEKNPFNLFTSPKKDKKLVEFLSHDEVVSFLDGNEKRTDKFQSRDQAILELIFASGLRASEVINLTFSMIDFENKTIRIIGKGNKERITHFNNKAKNAILLYKDKLRIILLGDKEDSGIVFLNSRGDKLTERGLEYIVDSSAKKAAFPLKVYPHMLRHSFATELMNNGADIRVIQELLGHESVSTTSIYTDVSFNDLKETYDKCFPKIMNGGANDKSGNF